MRQVEGYSLWLGNVGDFRDTRVLLHQEFEAVVDLALNEPPATLPRGIASFRFPLADGGGNPEWLLHGAVDMIATLLRANVKTLVYCGAGMSRTPAIAAAALMKVAGLTAAEALSRVVGSCASDVSPAFWNELTAALE